MLDQFLAFAAPASYDALQKYNDRQTMQNDLSRFQADPTYRIDPSRYANPETGIAVDTHMKGLRDFKLQEQATPALDKFAEDYANLAGPDKRFFADPASREVLQQSGLQLPDGTSNPFIRKGLQDFRQQGQLENDMGDVLANSGDVSALARVASNPLAQAQHNILNTLQTSQDKALTRSDAQSKVGDTQQKERNVSDFQGAIAGLTAPSQAAAPAFAPYDKAAAQKAWETGTPFDVAQTGSIPLSQFAKRGGYDTLPGVESDIRQAAAAYGAGDSPEVNKAVTDARDTYKSTFLPQQTMQVGRTTVTGQRNLLDDFRKDATSTAPVVKVSVNTPAGPDAISRDAQAILAGQLAPKTLSKRGGYDAKVRAEILRQNPTFDFVKADANAAFAQNSGNLNSRALIQGVEPLYTKLLEAGKELGNSNIPGVNKVKNWVKEATGQPEIVAFNNLRDDVIAESERVLMNSGVLSDSKYTRAVNNVKSSASMPQLKAALAQLRLTVKSRLEALDRQPYPAQQKQPAGPMQVGKYKVVVH